jgi:predicted dehydrogenase
MTMEPVRFGLVGYGFGGRYFHAPLLHAAEECELVGVLTSSPERQALVGDELPGVPTFSSLEGLIAAGAEAVAISTPADTHSALTDQALELGLAVVCDKPFALDGPTALATVQLAEQRGLALSPYQNRRWDSDFLTVKKLVDEGGLGEVTRFESRFERFAPDRGPGPSGGGTLRDFGSHLADQALFLLGPVDSVYAEFTIRDNGLDDDVFVAFTHENGARSHWSGGWRQSAPGPRFRVTGTSGTFILPAADTQEDLLLAGGTPKSLGDAWGVEPEGSWGHLHRGAATEVVPTQRGRWDAFYPSFARAVRGEGPLPVEPRNAVATATALDAARVSAQTGAVVPVPRGD